MAKGLASLRKSSPSLTIGVAVKSNIYETHTVLEITTIFGLFSSSVLKENVSNKSREVEVN